MKERMRRAYPYSDESYEQDLPAIGAQLAAKEMANHRPASIRDYINGLSGGHGESLEPMNL
jgi:hypothetical protein